MAIDLVDTLPLAPHVNHMIEGKDLLKVAHDLTSMADYVRRVAAGKTALPLEKADAWRNVFRTNASYRAHYGSYGRGFDSCLHELHREDLRLREERNAQKKKIEVPSRPRLLTEEECEHFPTVFQAITESRANRIFQILKITSAYYDMLCSGEVTPSREEATAYIPHLEKHLLPQFTFYASAYKKAAAKLPEEELITLTDEERKNQAALLCRITRKLTRNDIGLIVGAPPDRVSGALNGKRPLNKREASRWFPRLKDALPKEYAKYGPDLEATVPDSTPIAVDPKEELRKLVLLIIARTNLAEVADAVGEEKETLNDYIHGRCDLPSHILSGWEAGFREECPYWKTHAVRFGHLIKALEEQEAATREAALGPFCPEDELVEVYGEEFESRKPKTELSFAESAAPEEEPKPPEYSPLEIRQRAETATLLRDVFKELGLSPKSLAHAFKLTAVDQEERPLDAVLLDQMAENNPFIGRGLFKACAKALAAFTKTNGKGPLPRTDAIHVRAKALLHGFDTLV